jgi:flagellar basal body P-ring formation protein FlgA
LALNVMKTPCNRLFPRQVSCFAGIFAWVLLGFSTLAHAAAIESLQRIQQAAEAYIHLQHAKYPDLQLRFGYLDSRLRLPRCDQSLQGYFPDHGNMLGQTAVGVRCEGSATWKVVIPVQIRVFADVVIARDSLAKGTLLQTANLTLERKELSAIQAGAYTQTSDVAGMILKRPVNQSTILTPAMLQPRRLVQRGETVTILAQAADITVRVQGVALMDGHRGQTIRVQNSRSGREVHAEVIDPAIVRIKM